MQAFSNHSAESSGDSVDSGDGSAVWFASFDYHASSSRSRATVWSAPAARRTAYRVSFCFFTINEGDALRFSFVLCYFPLIS